VKTVFCIFVVFVAFQKGSFCQTRSEDILILQCPTQKLKVENNNHRTENLVNNTDIMQLKHKGVFAKYNPFSLLATASMYFYQNAISPLIFSHCLYHRSCSNYSKAAIKEFGLIKGIFMSADRLLRCNLTAVNDIDPNDFTLDGHAMDEPSKYHICK
jgi:putative component of membrane protein insertase Oxa1/YidC/SpoIIIJ protein YidD